MSVVTASSAAAGSAPVDPVRVLQHALYRAAKADPGRRFHALRDKIFRKDVLWRAWVAVFRNDGAPGIDKATLADVQEYGVARLLEVISPAGFETVTRQVYCRALDAERKKRRQGEELGAMFGECPKYSDLAIAPSTTA